MSRIVPKLNLNKTPQLVENNSLVMAKNIRLLEDGTIGPDTSLEEIETKIGNATQTTVHHNAVTETLTDYQYTILDCDTAVEYVRDEISPDEQHLDDVAFDFIGYGPGTGRHDVDDHDKYVKVSHVNQCSIYCYTIHGDEIYWIRERFRYNPNEAALITNGGYYLALAVREDIYDEEQQHPVGPLDYFYTSVPRLMLGRTVNVKKYNYVLINPVYPTSETETITITPAYDEVVTKYDTLKYIGQIVGLNNKIYFFKEELNIQYSQEAVNAIYAKYPNERFVDDKPIPNTTPTFDVNSDNYVTRRGELFEDRDIAEELTNSFNNRVKIYEYDEVTKEFKVVKCAWKYSGGKINGCVTVNSTGEPILTICEYDVPADKLVPIKHINLAKCKYSDNESFYTQAPNIPITNLINVRRYVKNIPAGVYQFFIRYKIHDEFYTNWFPCSKELFAASMKQTDTLQGSLKHIDIHQDSNYSFIFQVKHLFPQYCSKFEQYQLGFIISAEGGVFARSWKHFDMSSAENIDIYFEYNQEDIEEINIDDLLKVTYDIFNVANIAPYKNKLYIANYTETDFNENLDSYAKKIKVKLKWQTVFDDNASVYYFTNLPLYESSTTGVYDRFGLRYIKDTFGEHDYCIINDNYTNTSYNEIIRSVLDYRQAYGQTTGPEYTDPYDEFRNVITRVYIKYNNTRYYLHGDGLTEYNEELTSLDNNFILESFIDDVRNVIIGVDSDGNYKALLNGVLSNVDNIVVEYKTYNIIEDPSIVDYDPAFPEEPIYGGWRITPIVNTVTRTINLKDLISSTVSFSEEYREYNTLLPFTKYDFYVHFVKQNGIATNGYFIGTKEIKRYCKGYVQTSRHSAPYTDLSSNIDLDDMCFYDPSNKGCARYYNTDIDDYIYYYMMDDEIDGKTIIYPEFSNIQCPTGYVGCFFSISKYGNNVAQAFNREQLSNVAKGYTTRLDCLELDCMLYNTLNNIKVYDSDGTLLSKTATYHSSSTTNPLEHLGCSGIVEYSTDEEQITTRKTWIIFDSTNKPYHKTLIKVTPYIKLKKQETTSYGNYDDANSPGYLCDVKKLDRDYCAATNTAGVANEDGYYVSGSDIYTRNIVGANIDLDEVDEHVDYHYSNSWFILSNFNLNYVSLTQDLNPVVRRYNVDSTSEPVTSDQQFITVVDSLICSFILELKSMYRDYTRKLYYEYTKNKFTKFDNTIRTSSIDVDEIYRYIYRFEATDYYNVPTQRGIITNLVAVANTLYVHCEHSLFKFTDNKTLNGQEEEITLQENDIFNSGISEVFDAQYGYAGLKTREHSLVTYNAYIFYDEVAKVIYAFGGEQQIGSISEPIKKLIDNVQPTDVRFLGDELHNRFFVNLYNRNGNVCLSFNFNSKSFVSIHDFDFDFGFHSRRHTYLVHQNMYEEHPMGWSIYKIADVIRVITSRTDNPLPPDPMSQSYTNNYAAYQNCYKRSLVHVPDCDDFVLFNEVKSVNSCVDIIVNTQYEAIKALNYISWICSEIKYYGGNENNVSEEVLDRHYPGTKIRIYSDATETSLFDLLNTYGEPKIANENRNIDNNCNPTPNSRNWQYPQYNCGIWSMNYFRDIKNSILFNVDADIFEYTDGDNHIGGNPGDSETTDLTPYITREYITQESSLLYGKYFVIRFIFNNKNFKLENLILRMNDYGKTK